MSCTWGTRGIVLRAGWRIDFPAVSVLLLQRPYDSHVGSNAYGYGKRWQEGRTGVSAYLASGDGGLMRAFVKAYCCSGESFAFRKTRASYWKRIRSGNVPMQSIRAEKEWDLVEQL